MKKGQIVLFVVVLLTITLIIVTSVMTRSLTSIKNTNVNTDSTRAFNAAESGLEELLNRTDLAAIAGNGTNYDITSVDPSTFTERKYTAERVESGYFQTSDALAKDTALQIEFNQLPSGVSVDFSGSSCLLLAAISPGGIVNRELFCGSGSGGVLQNATSCNSDCSITFTPAGAGTYILLAKVLVADSTVRVDATNFDTVSNTRNIRGKSWATTKSGVKKELEAVTKTTKDIYPVFDYALYLR